jgi:hypothetical protein
MVDDGLRPRVFISSVMEGYIDIRAAAAEGVEDGGGEPVMAERLPSLAVSPRNACLDGVRTSDAYLVLIGERAGWIAPSGALATEEEFDEAEGLGLPIIVFLQDVGTREEGATRFTQKASNYVSGRFRTKFEGTVDLRAKAAEAVRALRRDMKLPLSDPARVLELLEAGKQRSYDVYVRLALVPERRGEIVAPDRLESRDFVEELYAIGHDRKVRFFDHSFGKSYRISEDGALEITQSDERRTGGSVADVYLSEAGELVLNADLRERDLGDAIRTLLSIVEADLEAALQRAFVFASAILDHLDPHDRFAGVWVGAAIAGAENRYLYKAPPSGSAYVRSGGEGTIVAEPEPRKLTRAQLRSPSAEIQRLMARFRRQIGYRDR